MIRLRRPKTPSSADVEQKLHERHHAAELEVRDSRIEVRDSRIEFLENRNSELIRKHTERLPAVREARRVPLLEERIQQLEAIIRDRAETAVLAFPGRVQAQLRSDLRTLEHSSDDAERTAALASLQHHARSRPASGTQILDLAAALTIRQE